MRILAISGSLRRASHNTALLREAAELAPEGVEVELYEGLDRLPPYNEDDDTDHPPAEVTRLRDAIAEADAVLISTPEYNGTVPGQIKHAVDWASRPVRPGRRAVGQAGRGDRRQRHRLRCDLGPGPPAQGAGHRRCPRARGRAGGRQVAGSVRRRRPACRRGVARTARRGRPEPGRAPHHHLPSAVTEHDGHARTAEGTDVDRSGHGVGPVALTVSDLARSRQFYERAIGLRASDRDDGTVALSGARRTHAGAVARGQLRARAGSPRRPGCSTSRSSSPRAWTWRSRWRAWPRRAGRWTGPPTTWSARPCTCPIRTATGSRSTATGLAISGAVARVSSRWRRCRSTSTVCSASSRRALSSQRTAPAPTTIGHVHLQVADIPEAEAFYHGVLGFDVMVAAYPGALFVSAGGYHHHIGLNTWHSAGLGACGRRLGGLAALRRQPSRPGFAGRGARPGAGGRHPGACW